MAEEQKITTSKGEKIPYQYKRARQEGLTDEDIASYLSQETGYNLDEAYEAGLTPTDVITYLADVEDDPTAASTRGLLRGLAQSSGMVTGGMAGAPLGLPGIVGGALTGLVLAEGLNSIFLNDQEYTNIGAEAFTETMGAGVPMVAARS